MSGFCFEDTKLYTCGGRSGGGASSQFWKHIFILLLFYLYLLILFLSQKDFFDFGDLVQSPKFLQEYKSKSRIKTVRYTFYGNFLMIILKVNAPELCLEQVSCSLLATDLRKNTPSLWWRQFNDWNRSLWARPSDIGTNFVVFGRSVFVKPVLITEENNEKYKPKNRTLGESLAVFQAVAMHALTTMSPGIRSATAVGRQWRAWSKPTAAPTTTWKVKKRIGKTFMWENQEILWFLIFFSFFFCLFYICFDWVGLSMKVLTPVGPYKLSIHPTMGSLTVPMTEKRKR